jgi:hypothetical protein
MILMSAVFIVMIIIVVVVALKDPSPFLTFAVTEVK